MIEQLICDYIASAEEATLADFSDKKAVRRFNTLVDRMRSIVAEVVSFGQDAVKKFSSVLDKEPAAAWAAHHLVEIANVDSVILSRCFARVEQAKAEAEAKGNSADAIGEDMWIREWKAKKA